MTYPRARLAAKLGIAVALSAPMGCQNPAPPPEPAPASAPRVSAPSPSQGGGYKRGTTSYSQGESRVREEDVSASVTRSYEGIRVAGPDTDIIPDYWDGKREELGDARAFEVFESRLTDLKARSTEAEVAALASFEDYCRKRGVLPAFQRFHYR